MPPPTSPAGTIGTIAPARASTGIDSRSRCRCSIRPPAYRTPVKTSTQVPSGSQAVTRPRPVAGSTGVVIGATSSSVPNMNWCGTS